MHNFSKSFKIDGEIKSIPHKKKQRVRTQKSLNKFKTEIISSIFTDHSAMKLEINHKNTEKYTKTWKLNNRLLNNDWVNNKIKKESKDTLKQMKMRTQQPKICRTQGKQFYEGNS